MKVKQIRAWFELIIIRLKQNSNMTYKRNNKIGHLATLFVYEVQT